MCLNVRIRFNSLTLVHYKLQFAEGRRGHSEKKSAAVKQIYLFPTICSDRRRCLPDIPQTGKDLTNYPCIRIRRRSIKLGHGSGGGWRVKEVCPAGIAALSKKKAINKKNR